MASNVFCFTTILAGIYPAINVAVNNIIPLTKVPINVATNIPSLNGKFIGWITKYGFIMKNISIDPRNIPQSA